MKRTHLLPFGKMVDAWKAERLLDFEMSDGCVLRNLTARECWESGDAWLKTLSRRIGTNKLGEAFNETMLGFEFFLFYSYEIRISPLRRERPQPGDEL